MRSMLLVMLLSKGAQRKGRQASRSPRSCPACPASGYFAFAFKLAAASLFLRVNTDGICFKKERKSLKGGTCVNRVKELLSSKHPK